MASEKRIKDFEPASDIELDDWFAIDSPSAGTRKVQLAQMLEAIQTQVTAIADELAVLDGEVDTHDTSISNLQTKVGSAALTTEAPDLSGAINEHESDISGIDSDISDIQSGMPTTTTNSGWRIISFPNIKMRILAGTMSITYPANTSSNAFSFTFPTNSFDSVYTFHIDASVNGRTDTAVRYVRGSANGCQAYIACGATSNTSGTVYVTAIGHYS